MRKKPGRAAIHSCQLLASSSKHLRCSYRDAFDSLHNPVSQPTHYKATWCECQTGCHTKPTKTPGTRAVSVTVLPIILPVPGKVIPYSPGGCVCVCVCTQPKRCNTTHNNNRPTGGFLRGRIEPGEGMGEGHDSNTVAKICSAICINNFNINYGEFIANLSPYIRLPRAPTSRRVCVCVPCCPNSVVPVITRADTHSHGTTPFGEEDRWADDGVCSTGKDEKLLPIESHFDTTLESLPACTFECVCVCVPNIKQSLC